MGGDYLEKTPCRFAVVDGPVDEGLGTALDRGQGGAQLVRHVGDEILAHGLQAALAGDVEKHRNRAAAEPLADDRRHPDVDMALFAAEFDLEIRSSPRPRGFGDRFLDAGVAHQLDQGHAGTPCVEPEHSRQGGIGQEDAVVGAGHEDPLGDAVEDGFEPRFLGAELGDAVLDLSVHVAQGPGEVVKLPACQGGSRYVPAVFPGGHLPGAAGHLDHRARFEARSPVGEDDGDREAEQGGQPDGVPDMALRVLDLVERHRQAQHEPVVAGNEPGDVEHVGLEGVAEAQAAADAPGPGRFHLGPVGVVVEPRQGCRWNLGIADHHAVGIDQGKTQPQAVADEVGLRVERFEVERRLHPLPGLAGQPRVAGEVVGDVVDEEVPQVAVEVPLDAGHDHEDHQHVGHHQFPVEAHVAAGGKVPGRY